MEIIRVKIDWDRNYGAASDSVSGCVAVDNSLDGVKKEYEMALQTHFAGMKKDGDVVPDEYVLEFELSARALLHSLEGKTTLKAISRATGINHKQLSHYYTGEKNPRPAQREKIIKGIHAIGKELTSVV